MEILQIKNPAENKPEQEKPKRITLVFPKVDKENFQLYTNFPAVGIHVLDASLERNLNNHEIDCVDLNQENASVEKWGEYACFSITAFNFNSSMGLIKQAKKSGATVIVGGVHPSLVKEKMLTNPDIDYVIIGEADEALPNFINGESLENIPGLIYRDGDEIISNPRPVVNINKIKINYEKMMKEGGLPNIPPFGRTLPYFSQRGCLWGGMERGKCLFCSIPDLQLRNKDPKIVWQDITMLCERFKPDIIWDTCDSFTGDREWLHNLAQSKPAGDLPAWFSYTRANELIKDGVVEDLKKIGFKYVFIGLESGNNEVLRKLNKGLNAMTSIRAVEKLATQDIKVIGTFVLGSPGETKESIQDTLNLAKILHKNRNIHAITANLLIPFMGSEAFNLILQKLRENGENELYESYFNAVYIPLEELQQTYLRLLCPNLTYDELSDYADEINALNKQAGPRLLPRKQKS